MFAILKKEISSFFSSAIGYLVIGLFLVVTGLFLWVFQGPFNITETGFADLAPFFQIAPWIFIFLIPAITMRSFSEEQKVGTLELLLTKPISKLQLTLGKFLGAFALIILAIIPTLIYVIAIYQLGNPVGNLDVGVTIGSYIGLMLLAATFTAIGIFASSLTDNQIIAFIIAVFLSFFLYFGLAGIAAFSTTSSVRDFINLMGLQSHYTSISRGVVDTRDLIYFISVTAFFIIITMMRLHKRSTLS
ncbi:ABC-2 type transport system permease protein [Dokdonia sp. Hel_I_63]|uniref:gliding motility-associated ABC transporter permease subunit GldF n=1 Tax=unclassified Dokdonia TaxID=2615033 RepID=UPI00020A7552|nr:MULTISPECIES: gliding motility-associated ABC transporter permease subunit GldF [unclassified Dokdonia]AEE20889.1 gliding motility-associated ABC transporter permease protein GldF [Dokdonia sp. 4H-3-7-5]TVZ22864.1 ABC-2 type transport system permease protein [Dokdonia sp. Hel_I_63]